MSDFSPAQLEGLENTEEVDAQEVIEAQAAVNYKIHYFNTSAQTTTDAYADVGTARSGATDAQISSLFVKAGYRRVTILATSSHATNVGTVQLLGSIDGVRWVPLPASKAGAANAAENDLVVAGVATLLSVDTDLPLLKLQAKAKVGAAQTTVVASAIATPLGNEEI